MSELGNSVDVTEENFQQVMFEESAQRLVLLDFWADWCAPCKALGPILEKLAAEYDGQILLAKVNADEQQNIVAQFGIRSLPTVALVKDGQPFDAFQGAEPESAIRERLEKHLPPPWQPLLDQAAGFIAEQQYDAALAELLNAYRDSGELFDIGLLLADCYLHLKRTNEAAALLDAANLEQQLDANYKALVSRLELMEAAADTPEIRDLQTQLASDPDNLELQYELAVQYSQAERVEEALEVMLGVLKKERNYKDGDAKKRMLDILKGLGNGDPLAVRYQRKLFTLMY